jgi:hypothetical protein
VSNGQGSATRLVKLIIKSPSPPSSASAHPVAESRQGYLLDSRGRYLLDDGGRKLLAQ